MDLGDARTDGLKLSLKLYHARELQLNYQQLMTEAPLRSGIVGFRRRESLGSHAMIMGRPDFTISGVARTGGILESEMIDVISDF
jgi:hypothetical protein